MDRLDALLAERIGELKRMSSLDPRYSIAQSLFLEATSALLCARSAVDWPDIIDRLTVQALLQSVAGAWHPDLIEALGHDEWQHVSGVFLDSALAGLPGRLRQYYKDDLKRFRWPALRPTEPGGPAAQRVRAVCEIQRAGYAAPGKVKCSPYPRETQGEHCLVCAVYTALLCRLRELDPICPVLMALFHHLSAPLMPNFDHEGELLTGSAHSSAIEQAGCRMILRDFDDPLRSALSGIFPASGGSGELSGMEPFQEADVLDRVLQVRYYSRMASVNVEQAVAEYELLNRGRWYDSQIDLLVHYGWLKGRGA